MNRQTQNFAHPSDFNFQGAQTETMGQIDFDAFSFGKAAFMRQMGGFVPLCGGRSKRVKGSYGGNSRHLVAFHFIDYDGSETSRMRPRASHSEGRREHTRAHVAIAAAFAEMDLERLADLAEARELQKLANQARPSRRKPQMLVARSSVSPRQTKSARLRAMRPKLSGDALRNHVRAVLGLASS